MKQRYEETKAEVVLETIEKYENLRDHGLPEFDAELIQSLDEALKNAEDKNDYFKLAGQRDDRFLFFGMDIQPENRYYRAFYKNSIAETIPQQIHAMRLQEVKGIQHSESVQLSPEEVTKFTDLDSEGYEISYNPDPYKDLVTAEAFTQYVEELRANLKDKAEGNLINECLDAPTFDLTEAQNIAEAFLNKLEIDNLALVKKEGAVFLDSIPIEGGENEYEDIGEPVWHLTYQPAFNGIVFPYDRMGIYTQPFYLDEEVSAETTPADWQFEHIDIYLNDRGIVAFDYFSPMEVSEITEENPELLSVDEIIEIAKEMLPITLENQNSDGDLMEARIDQMNLAYWRVIDEDNPESATVIPVWNFYGAINRSFTDIMGEKQLIVEDSPNLSDTILTLNAIDGTVVELARFR